MKLILIEDDTQLNTTITNFLKFKGYETLSCYDGDSAIEMIDESNFDIYIIDINIPDINGLELVKYIRRKDSNGYIIMITASLELDNFKNAFLNGCNEYIKKPFYLEELEIRIDNLLEKKQESSTLKLSENMFYDLKNDELIKDEEIVHLRKKEKRLLNILLQNLNKTVLTQTIQDYVWENEIKESYPLRQLMSDLKQKVCTKHSCIVTKKSIGYRFEIKL